MSCAQSGAVGYVGGVRPGDDRGDFGCGCIAGQLWCGSIVGVTGLIVLNYADTAGGDHGESGIIVGTDPCTATAVSYCLPGFYCCGHRKLAAYDCRCRGWCCNGDALGGFCRASRAACSAVAAVAYPGPWHVTGRHGRGCAGAAEVGSRREVECAAVCTTAGAV